MIDLPPTLLAPIVGALERGHGLVADSPHLTILGSCRACAPGAVTAEA